MNSINGMLLVRLTNEPAFDEEPAYSPDGSRIAFRTFRDGNYEIYFMNPIGTLLVRLTNDPAFDGEPSYSPDGTRIAFTTNRDGNYEIYTMISNGTGLVNLTNNPTLHSTPIPTGRRGDVLSSL